MTTPTPTRVLIGSTVLSAVIVVAGFLFANPPQCPFNVTEAEMLATNCNVGANIGLGILVLLAAALFVSGIVVAGVLHFQRYNQPPPPAPSD